MVFISNLDRASATNCSFPGMYDTTSLEHALDCKKGGLVTQRHNEVRDVIGDLASVVFKEIVKEPVVQEANDAEGVPSLIANLSIRGVWQPQTVALFDVRVTDTDALFTASCFCHSLFS